MLSLRSRNDSENTSLLLSGQPLFWFLVEGRLCSRKGGCLFLVRQFKRQNWDHLCIGLRNYESEGIRNFNRALRILQSSIGVTVRHNNLISHQSGIGRFLSLHSRILGIVITEGTSIARSIRLSGGYEKELGGHPRRSTNPGRYNK